VEGDDLGAGRDGCQLLAGIPRGSQRQEGRRIVMPGTPRGGGVAEASKDGDSAPALAPKGSVWRVGAPTVVLKASAIKERPLVREDDLSTWAGPPLGVSQRGFDTLSLVKTRAGPALDV
jgi:hypothetical protein